MFTLLCYRILKIYQLNITSNVYIILLVLVTTSLGGQFEINCPRALLKIWNNPSTPRSISKFSKTTRVIYHKNFPSQTCEYWLITTNKQALCNETNIFLTVGNYKSASEQLQNRRQLENNTVKAAMLIKINHVITEVNSLIQLCNYQCHYFQIITWLTMTWFLIMWREFKILKTETKFLNTFKMTQNLMGYIFLGYLKVPHQPDGVLFLQETHSIAKDEKKVIRWF